jgi:flagellar biosynthesis/type III secretory pathway ATPase
VLDRAIGAKGRYPAVDVLVSLSRVMGNVVAPAHVHAAKKLRALMATYEAKKDLLALGAYTKGSDREFDLALERMPLIEQFLQQDANERVSLESTVELLQKCVS